MFSSQGRPFSGTSSSNSNSIPSHLFTKPPPFSEQLSKAQLMNIYLFSPAAPARLFSCLKTRRLLFFDVVVVVVVIIIKIAFDLKTTDFVAQE